MRYMLNIFVDESSFGDATEEQRHAMTAAYEAFTHAAAEAGILRAGEGLQGSQTATTVRVRDGERLLSDGPFAETREQLGGFYLVEVDDLDAALSWAAKIPGASTGAVEVRPVMEYQDRTLTSATDLAAQA